MRYLWLVLALALSGCGPKDDKSASLGPAAIAEGDECHLCGMLISQLPGPKGQAVSQRHLHKFCSTRDLLNWALDPEHSASVTELWVHDMAQSQWHNPADTAFIDGRQAWYVLGSRARGAMGPTLASFADQAQAQAFAKQQGGQVLAFSALSLDTLARLQGDFHPDR